LPVKTRLPERVASTFLEIFDVHLPFVLNQNSTVRQRGSPIRPPLRDRKFADSLLEGGVRCELVSKVSFIRRSDEFLESIKKGIETSNPSLRPNSLLAGKIQGILLSRPPAAG
jgi:hypothetical protein